MLRLLILSALGCGLALLAGCGNSVTPLEISTSPVERPVLILPPVDEVNTRSIKWIVITPSNFESKMAELIKNGESLAIIGLIGSDFENLSLNISDLRLLIEQQQRIIIAYERYYNRATVALSNAVTVN